MCGLVGIIVKSNNGFFQKHVDMFNELLFVDTLRGDDSTGVFMVDKHGDLEMIKEASSAPDFQKTVEYKALTQAAYRSGRLLIGHNRKATKGVISDENAHPFVVDNRIVLVHNGTLYGDYQKLVGEDNKVDVDSHAIAHLIHQEGDDVEAALRKLQGAYALIWFDMKKQTLNFVRNSQRPLHFLESHDCYMWASEANMLEWMVARHRLQNTNIKELKAGVLTQFEFTNHSVKVSNQELDLFSYSGGASDNDDRFRYHAYDVWEKYMPWEPESRPQPPKVENYPSIPAVTKYEEETLAARLNCASSATDFMAKTRFMETGKDVAITCVDYDYISGKDGSHGYFLYGTACEDESILLRVYVPQDFPEIDLVDLTSNYKLGTITVTSKHWRRFEDEHYSKYLIDPGFGMVLGRNFRRPTTGEVQLVALPENA